MTDLTPDIERVLSEHRIVYQSDGDCGEIRWIECSCDNTSRDNWTGDTEEDHEAHLAEQIAALVEQAEGDHLAAFLAQLPGDLFSETEIQRVREWDGEWSG